MESMESKRSLENLFGDKDSFISQELKESAEIPTGIKASLHRRDEKNIELIIADGSMRSLRQIEQSMDIQQDVLNRFSSLQSHGSYNRPLLYASISELTPRMIFVGYIETSADVRRRGIATAFYAKLEENARQNGYRFLTGYHNDTDTAKFFLRRGRYLLDEIKLELQKEFESLRNQDDDPTLFFTIRFLDAHDEESYINNESLEKSLDKRLEDLEKRGILNDLLTKIEGTIKKLEGGEEMPGTRATLIEVLEDIEAGLGEKKNASDLDEENPNLLIDAARILETLWAQKNVLLQSLTRDELEENLSVLV